MSKTAHELGSCGIQRDPDTTAGAGIVLRERAGPGNDIAASAVQKQKRQPRGCLFWRGGDSSVSITEKQKIRTLYEPFPPRGEY